MRILSVRLPENELRRVKSLAASRGVTVQEAVHEALEAWAAQSSTTPPDPLTALEGSLADVDVDNLRRNERELEHKRDRRWV